MHKPKAVLFDWDGTIVDTRESILVALNKTLKDFGKQEIESYDQSGKTLEILTDILGADVAKAVSVLKIHLKNESCNMLRLFDGITELLYALKNDNIYTGIVSNKFCDLLRKEVQLTQLDKCFDVIVGSGDTSKDKPSAAPVLHALSKLKIKPCSNVFFVGDSVIDMECAKNAGVTGIIYGSEILKGFEDNQSILAHKELLDALCNNSSL